MNFIINVYLFSYSLKCRILWKNGVVHSFCFLVAYYQRWCNFPESWDNNNFIDVFSQNPRSYNLRTIGIQSPIYRNTRLLNCWHCLLPWLVIQKVEVIFLFFLNAKSRKQFKQITHSWLDVKPNEDKWLCSNWMH